MKRNLVLTLAMVMTLIFAVSASGNSLMKGSLFMSGAWSAGFSVAGGDLNENSEGDGYTNIRFAPCFGFFLIDGLALGATIDFANSSQGDFSATNLYFGPKILFYPTAASSAGEVKGQFLPYLMAEAKLGSSKTDNGSSDEFKTSGSVITFGGGGTYMFSNSLGVIVEGFYELQSMKQKEPVESDSFSGNEFGVFIGVIGFFDLGN